MPDILERMDAAKRLYGRLDALFGDFTPGQKRPKQVKREAGPAKVVAP